jgi:hypothetical protein
MAKIAGLNYFDNIGALLDTRINKYDVGRRNAVAFHKEAGVEKELLK